jgi:hypothetical protein
MEKWLAKKVEEAYEEGLREAYAEFPGKFTNEEIEEKVAYRLRKRRKRGKEGIVWENGALQSRMKVVKKKKRNPAERRTK